MARPSKFTPDLGERVCALIASGMSLEKVAEQDGMPSDRTILRWLAAKDPEGGTDRPYETFLQQYLRAREVRADARFERIDTVIEDMRTKKIDHNVARVQIDAIKWQTGIENAKRYSDKLRLADADGNNLPAPQFIVAPIAPAPPKDE